MKRRRVARNGARPAQRRPKLPRRLERLNPMPPAMWRARAMFAALKESGDHIRALNRQMRHDPRLKLDALREYQAAQAEWSRAYAEFSKALKAATAEVDRIIGDVDEQNVQIQERARRAGLR